MLVVYNQYFLKNSLIIEMLQSRKKITDIVQYFSLEKKTIKKKVRRFEKHSFHAVYISNVCDVL